jgi:hypothetical protein
MDGGRLLFRVQIGNRRRCRLPSIRPPDGSTCSSPLLVVGHGFLLSFVETGPISMTSRDWKRYCGAS